MKKATKQARKLNIKKAKNNFKQFPNDLKKFSFFKLFPPAACTFRKPFDFFFCFALCLKAFNTSFSSGNSREEKFLAAHTCERMLLIYYVPFMSEIVIFNRRVREWKRRRRGKKCEGKKFSLHLFFFFSCALLKANASTWKKISMSHIS